MAVFAIGVMHAAPVVVFGIMTKSRAAVTTTAIVMGLISILTGRGGYAIIDLFFVGVGYFVGLAFCQKREKPIALIPENHQSFIQEYVPERAQEPEMPEVTHWSGTDRFLTHELASQYAKKLARLSRRSVSVQEGHDGYWYAGPAQDGPDLVKAYEHFQERCLRQEKAKNLDKAYDEDLDVCLMKKESDPDMASTTRFWVGSNDAGVLVFDKEMQIDGAAHVFLWNVGFHEMQRYSADLARPHMTTVKDNNVATSAIESYLAWHGASAAAWLAEERQYQGARKSKEAAEEQARRSLAEKHAQYLANGGFSNNGTRLSSSRNFHRTPPCWRCGQKLDNSVDIECVSCGWIICRCGACGCGM